MILRKRSDSQNQQPLVKQPSIQSDSIFKRILYKLLKKKVKSNYGNIELNNFNIAVKDCESLMKDCEKKSLFDKKDWDKNNIPWKEKMENLYKASIALADVRINIMNRELNEDKKSKAQS